MSATKDVDDLVRAIKATGSYDVRSDGRHHKVLNSAGNTVYVLPRSPSDRRWRENAVHHLIQAGVFEHDPRKGNGHKQSKSNLSDPDVQAKKVAALRARHAHYAEITNGIRARLEPLINKVGGWGARKGQVTAAELGVTAMYWGRNRPDVFRSEGGAKSSAQSNMKQGGTCSEQACAFWNAFVTAWESAEDPRRWYFDLVRESKGLEKTNVIVGGEEQREIPKTTKTRSGKVRTYMAETSERHPLEPEPLVGQLALKAVFLMTVGRESVDENDVLAVGEEILALETKIRDFTLE